MLTHLRDSGKLTERKARLFAVACSHIVWPFMTDERSRQAVEIGEQFADGLVGQKALKAARRNAFAASKSPSAPASCRTYPTAAEHAGIVALNVCMDTKHQSHWEMANATAGCANSLVFHAQGDTAGWADRRIQCDMLRCIFGDSFSPVVFEASWLTWHSGVVRTLAQSVYDDRAFDLLPILADALEEAGCCDTMILAHCRQRREHRRGCWVVDLILGKQ
jgi:hypothetical protein